jgi:hypothetical protein
LDASKENANKMVLSCISSEKLRRIYPEYKRINSRNTLNMNNMNKNLIEGFTVNNSLGERFIPTGECPVGFKNINGKCEQVCVNCNYNENDDLYINNSSLCNMDEYFDGIDNNGYLICKKQKNRDKNNDKYDTYIDDYLDTSIYLADSTLLLK